MPDDQDDLTRRSRGPTSRSCSTRTHLLEGHEYLALGRSRCEPEPRHPRVRHRHRGRRAVHPSIQGSVDGSGPGRRDRRGLLRIGLGERRRDLLLCPRRRGASSASGLEAPPRHRARLRHPDVRRDRRTLSPRGPSHEGRQPRDLQLALEVELGGPHHSPPTDPTDGFYGRRAAPRRHRVRDRPPPRLPPDAHERGRSELPVARVASAVAAAIEAMGRGDRSPTGGAARGDRGLRRIPGLRRAHRRHAADAGPRAREEPDRTGDLVGTLEEGWLVPVDEVPSACWIRPEPRVRLDDAALRVLVDGDSADSARPGSANRRNRSSANVSGCSAATTRTAT